MNSVLYRVCESLVVGALAAVTILYGFQTRVPYPDIVLRTLNHPWVIVLVGIFALLTFKWSPQAAVLILLLLAAFCVDTMAFARPLPQLLNQTPAEQLSRYTDRVHEHDPVPFDQRDLMIVRVPGVGVTATEAGVALSSVPLPVPQYPTFAMTGSSSSRYSDAAFTAPKYI